MPIKIVEGLPVGKKLIAEGVNVIYEERALRQDIRPLRIAILNLMPTKEVTELQLLRLIGGTPLQIDIDLLHTSTYHSRNISSQHLAKYYKTFDEIKDEYYDGLIITGAPVEQLAFRDVDYYDELVAILQWSEQHVYSRFFICWGAQFALNYYYQIDKIALEAKLFGIFTYDVLAAEHPYLRGFNDTYFVPESRHTTINAEQINKVANLKVLTSHPILGPDLVATPDQRDLFIFGHLEYDRNTLELEYQRDIKQGLSIDVPVNYYPNDNPELTPKMTWRSNAYILFGNWLNETYQNTYYDLTRLDDDVRTYN